MVNCSTAFQSFFNVLTCLKTFSAALGILRFTCDHEVPAVHRRLNHNKTDLFSGNSLMILASYCQYLPSKRSRFSVNWITLHPALTSLEMSLNLDIGLQQISIGNLASDRLLVPRGFCWTPEPLAVAYRESQIGVHWVDLSYPWMPHET